MKGQNTWKARTRLALPVLLVVAAALVLQGCTIGKIISATTVPLSAVQRGSPVVLTLNGAQTCTLMRIYWGDGQWEDVVNYNFDDPNRPTFTHIYNGWGGKKIITVEGVTNCGGSVVIDTIDVQPPTTDLGFGLSTTGAPCWVVPNGPALRDGTTVYYSPAGSTKINFGCAFSGCIYDADGEPNSSAPVGFPFPTYRKYSLIFRVGTQVVQGGRGGSFVTNQDGLLEVCANDDSFADNTGAWGITFIVDEPSK